MTSSRKWVISFFHGIVLVAFALAWLNTDLTYGDETLLVKWASIVKRVVLRIDTDPPKNGYLFVDLAYDKALAPRTDGAGNDVITDRAQLARYFGVVKRHPRAVRYTLCDVFLQNPSDADAALADSLAGLKNVVFPTHVGDDGKPAPLAINVPAALADYRQTGGQFLKFRIVRNDGVKTLPVKLYEDLEGKRLPARSLRNVIVDYQVRPYELLTDGEYPVVSLSELLLLPENVLVNDFLKGRVVVMGDFENDEHDTIFGTSPGTLILLNVYLALKGGYQQVNVVWLLFLLAAFTAYSRLVLFPAANADRRPEWLSSLLGNVTLLAVISVISYLLFNVHIQVLVIAVYVSVLRFCVTVKKQDLTWRAIREGIMDFKDTYFNFS